MELLPFKQAVDNGVGMIMVGHISLPGLDDSNRPASQSFEITTNLLRHEWGYNGIGDMSPGQGYQIKTNANCILQY